MRPVRDQILTRIDTLVNNMEEDAFINFSNLILSPPCTSGTVPSGGHVTPSVPGANSPGIMQRIEGPLIGPSPWRHPAEVTGGQPVLAGTVTLIGAV